MNIREIINAYQGLGIVVALIVILLALATVIVQATRPGHSSSSGMIQKTRAFYSDDDGGTWFVDDGVKIVPFEHNGKSAVRAMVFRCKGSKPFVGFLQRYSDAVIAKLNAASSQNTSPGPALAVAPMEVKKPGERTWVGVEAANPAGMNAYLRIVRPTCPDGEVEGLTTVSPGDPDNGAQ